MKYFGRVITAMVTPFKNENVREIDEKSVRRLVKHLIENGTDSIVLAGTTGEGPTLNDYEKVKLFTLAREVLIELKRKDIKLIANVGSNDTHQSIEFAKRVKDLGVVDGMMVVNPYYNKPSQKGLYMHFKEIALCTELPIMLYNIPGRTHVNLDAETTLALSKIPNIVALKESSGNLSQASRIIQHKKEDFAVYSGDDNLTLPMLSIGGDGVVSVASHVIGNEIQEMIQLFKNGQVERASEMHRKYLDFFEGIFFETNPVPIKNILKRKEIIEGSVRLPLVDIGEKEKQKINDLMEYIAINKFPI